MKIMFFIVGMEFKFIVVIVSGWKFISIGSRFGVLIGVGSYMELEMV